MVKGVTFNKTNILWDTVLETQLKIIVNIQYDLAVQMI